MSSDTVKDDVSVVDSSVTQKHDAENLDDPEGSSGRANGDAHPSTAGVRRPGDNLVKNSAAKKCKMYSVRYFIMKSLNHHNIQQSVEKGIWATQVMNEPILEEAFNNSGRVILIFSVNMSGFFQGFAQMMSSVGWRRDSFWSQGSGGNNPWGRSFKVKWLRLNNLPFHKTLHLKNPLNEFKPVKISRDCQELSPEIGAALCELIDKETDENEKAPRNDFHMRWPGLQQALSVRDDGYNCLPVQMNWENSSTFYPSLIYQQQTEAIRSYMASQQSLGAFHSNGTKVKNPLQTGKSSDPQLDPETSRFESRGLPSDISSLSSAISEDEFLEMSYEEYLEAHSRNRKRFCQPAAVPSPRNQDSSTKERDDDSDIISDQGRRRKRSNSRSQS